MGYLRKMKWNQQSEPLTLYIYVPPFQKSWVCHCHKVTALQLTTLHYLASLPPQLQFSVTTFDVISPTNCNKYHWEQQSYVGRVQDSLPRSHGFESHYQRSVVSLSLTYYPHCLVLVQTRKKAWHIWRTVDWDIKRVLYKRSINIICIIKVWRGQWLSSRALDLGVASLRLTKGSVLCPWRSHFILCLVLVQPRKTGKHPDMTEKLLTGM